ncbi:hypothetical protein GCM10027168_11380 [Streptomyces capparidis]
MQAGTVLDGRHRLIEAIGAGGFGQVWKAHDPKVDRLVAVKVLIGDGNADSDRQVARFAREAAVAGGLSHPHIVTVHDFGSAAHDGRLYAYLVMQPLPGTSLSAVLEAGRLPLPNALYTAACVADALAAAHQAGLAHRDVKPSNIIVSSSGEAMVVAFGITKGSDARHDITTTGVLIGTPAYMAPEALSGTFDHRTDLYSLGCALYEMEPPMEPERLVGRLLANDPAQRPDSAEEVYGLLAGDRRPPLRPPPAQPRTRHHLRGVDQSARGHRRCGHPPAPHLPQDLPRLRHQAGREGGAGPHDVSWGRGGWGRPQATQMSRSAGSDKREGLPCSAGYSPQPWSWPAWQPY